jgi:hypothetical protein
MRSLKGLLSTSLSEMWESCDGSGEGGGGEGEFSGDFASQGGF